MICLLFLIVGFAYADGGVVTYDSIKWRMVLEANQKCVINHQNGVQKMIIAVTTKEKLHAKKGVWIFPVPSEAKKVSIDIVKGFPEFTNYQDHILNHRSRSIERYIDYSLASQIYPRPLLEFLAIVFDAGVMSKASHNPLNDFQVYQSVEKMGLRTEIISAKTAEAFETYLKKCKLNLPPAFRKILEEYIGKGYSFVVSWINTEKETFYKKNSYSIPISVFISFPTEEIYYPLKPTSIYREERVPALIFVVGHVYTDFMAANIDYFYKKNYFPERTFANFFFFKEKISPLKWTRILINSYGEDFTEDLWCEPGSPPEIKVGILFYDYFWFFFFFVYILCSCIASFLAGQIILKDSQIKKYVFFLWGLFNLFTLIGFICSTFLFKIELSKKVGGFSLRTNFTMTFSIFFLILSTISFSHLPYILSQLYVLFG